jgi:hypothetical protein
MLERNDPTFTTEEIIDYLVDTQSSLIEVKRLICWDGGDCEANFPDTLSDTFKINFKKNSEAAIKQHNRLSDLFDFNAQGFLYTNKKKQAEIEFQKLMPLMNIVNQGVEKIRAMIALDNIKEEDLDSLDSRETIDKIRIQTSLEFNSLQMNDPEKLQTYSAHLRKSSATRNALTPMDALKSVWSAAMNFVNDVYVQNSIFEMFTGLLMSQLTLGVVSNQTRFNLFSSGKSFLPELAEPSYNTTCRL